jgi:pyruvate-formate lyase
MFSMQAKKDLKQKQEVKLLITGSKIEVTERISGMREKVLSIKPSICTERAKFYTEAYIEYEDQPVIIRRAYALEKTLSNMTVFIDDGELIVGNQSSRYRAAPIFPEYAVEWLLEERKGINVAGT